jgi:hypothetical protein
VPDSFNPVTKKPQDKHKNDKPTLVLSLIPSKSAFKTGDVLDMEFKITNIGKDTIWLPDMVLGDEIRISVLDKNGKTFYQQTNGGDSKPTVNSITGYSDAMPLTPNYCWGSNTAVKSLKIVLTKPGIYTVYLSLTGTIQKRFYAQSLWQGNIETTKKIYVFPSSSQKKPNTK